MNRLADAAREFLSQKKIAVAGVSRDGNLPANLIYRKLRDEGYDVVPLNPNAETVEGDRCYKSVLDVPGPVDGVVIATPPEVASGVAKQCAEAGVPRVWLHRSFGAGSVSPEAVQVCNEHGIPVIAGACPMMYCEPVDLGHRCMRWLLGITGRLPDPD